MANPDRDIRVGLLSAAAYSGMFVFGMVMALLGAVLPALSGRLQFRVAEIGTLFLFMNFTMLACSLVVGAAMDRFGLKVPLAVGPLLVAVTLLLISRAARFEDLLPAVVLLGLGGGALNGGTNTLVVDLHEDPKQKASALNLLGVFFGFGALFLPFVIGALLEALGIGTLLTASAVVCAGVGLFAMGLRFPPPKQQRRLPAVEMRKLLGSALALVTAALLFFQSGIEFTMGGYIGTYLTRAVGLSVAGASWLLAAYWASLMVARIVLSRILLHADPHRVILYCAFGAGAGAALAATETKAVLTSAGILLCGLSLAGIYPTVLGIAGAAFREHSGTVFGMLFTVALAGGMALPWVSGHLAQAAGLRWVFVLVAVAFVAVLALGRLVARLSPATAT